MIIFFVIFLHQEVSFFLKIVSIVCMTGKDNIANLFRENYSQLYSFAFTLLKDEAAAHDAVHDVFADLLNSDINISIGNGYLMRSVRNRCLNIIRDMPIKENVERLVMTESGFESIFGNDLDYEENLDMIRRIIREYLPHQCSKVMLLRYESGYSYADIAEELGISKVVVYKHLKNGLDKIRAILFRKN